MRKYINGKIYDMTENDKLHADKIKITHKNKHFSDSENENRIKELEETVKELAAKLLKSN